MAVRLHQPLQAIEAEFFVARVVRLGDSVGVEADQIARFELGEAARVRRVGRRAEDRTAVFQVFDAMALEQKRIVVPRVRVDEDAARLEGCVPG